MAVEGGGDPAPGVNDVAEWGNRFFVVPLVATGGEAWGNMTLIEEGGVDRSSPLFAMWSSAGLGGVSVTAVGYDRVYTTLNMQGFELGDVTQIDPPPNAVSRGGDLQITDWARVGRFTGRQIRGGVLQIEGRCLDLDIGSFDIGLAEGGDATPLFVVSTLARRARMDGGVVHGGGIDTGANPGDPSDDDAYGRSPHSFFAVSPAHDENPPPALPDLDMGPWTFLARLKAVYPGLLSALRYEDPPTGATFEYDTVETVSRTLDLAGGEVVMDLPGLIRRLRIRVDVSTPEVSDAGSVRLLSTSGSGSTFDEFMEPGEWMEGSAASEEAALRRAIQVALGTGFSDAQVLLFEPEGSAWPTGAVAHIEAELLTNKETRGRAGLVQLPYDVPLTAGVDEFGAPQLTDALEDLGFTVDGNAFVAPAPCHIVAISLDLDSAATSSVRGFHRTSDNPPVDGLKDIPLLVSTELRGDHVATGWSEDLVAPEGTPIYFAARPGGGWTSPTEGAGTVTVYLHGRSEWVPES